MSLFTIADLHLSSTSDKPMDIFGPAWEDHAERLRENWQRTVTPDDTVVVAGDISWGMRPGDAAKDFEYLESLNGRKIILKGNHDYWWATMKKLCEFRDSVGAKSVDFLFNNAYYAEGCVICGTRGWFPAASYGDDDLRIVNREAARLRTSVLCGQKLQQEHENSELLVFLHYPPAFSGQRCAQICEVLSEYGIKRVWYGHLHGEVKHKLTYQIAGAALNLIAADQVGFTPVKIR